MYRTHQCQVIFFPKKKWSMGFDKILCTRRLCSVEKLLTPKRGCQTPRECNAEATSEQATGKPNELCPPRKIVVT